jgi:O-antigen/teichoic acid export membrane protein
LSETLPPVVELPGARFVTTSARKRFVFTVGMNLFRSGLSFSTAMLLARWLGPSTYGNLAFLLGTFAGVRALLDMGSGAAFFTFLSQRPRSRRFVGSFFLWLLAQFLVPLVAISVLFPSSWVRSIWHGEPRSLVVLAFVAAFMQLSVWPVVQQAGESQRRTYWIQGIGVFVVASHLLAVTLLWSFGALGLYAILGAVAVEYAAAAAVAFSRLHFAPREEDTAREPLFPKYLKYCLPLIPLAGLGFANEFVDRWLLQTYGGGVQQAYYSVGAQIASIALLATVSILNIFWKEIAEAHHRGDRERTSALYKRVTRLLFFVGAVAAGYLIPWSAELLRLILGAAYVGGATSLAIMLLFPIHQSMGQIGGTMLYATEHVSLQVMISIGTVLLGTCMTYLALAPATALVPGFGLGSTGLALKMVCTQLISANVLAYAISRTFNWSFDWIFQPLSLLGCVGLGWLAHAVVVFGVPGGMSVFVRLSFGAVLYTVLVACFLLVAPELAGLTRSELLSAARRVALKVHRSNAA